MTKTAIATNPASTPSTWDEAADQAAEELLDRFAVTGFGVDDLNAEIRIVLDALVAECFHGDSDPTVYLLPSIATYARDALLRLDAMPSIEQLTNLLADKQSNYGTGNILAFGLKGIIIRMSDKVARIENMTAHDRGDEVEPLTDAYVDLIGYAVIATMLANGTFELPLARDVVDPLDQALEDAYEATGHVDVVKFLQGEVTFTDENVEPMINALLAMYVEAGKRIPPVVRYFYL